MVSYDKGVKASVGLNLLVLVLGGGQSRGQAAVSYDGRAKAYSGHKILVLRVGAVSQAVKPRSPITGAARPVSSLTYQP